MRLNHRRIAQILLKFAEWIILNLLSVIRLYFSRRERAIRLSEFKWRRRQWASLPKDSFLRFGRARKNNRINLTHSWLASRSRLMLVSRGSSVATSLLHPRDATRCSGGYKPAHDRRRLRRRRRRVIVGFVAMLGIFHWRSSIQSRQKWPYRGATRAFCDPRGRYLFALSSRRTVKGPPFLSQLKGSWFSPASGWFRSLSTIRRAETINWCMTEVICDLPLVTPIWASWQRK